MTSPLGCVGASHWTAPPDADPARRNSCEIAELAKHDPMAAAHIISSTSYPAFVQAELASEIARNLADDDSKTLKGLARTNAGRDFLDALETALSKGRSDEAIQAQIDLIHGARLSAIATPDGRANELMRQATAPWTNTALLGKNLASEVKNDMNNGAKIAIAILRDPRQVNRYRIATEIASNLTDQELLTLAKTRPALVQQMRAALEAGAPLGFRNEAGGRVEDALDPNLDSYAHHVAQVQSDLYAKGLPISAKGVEIYVIEAPDRKREHAAAVVRMIVGESGLAKDAHVGVPTWGRYDTKYLDKQIKDKKLDIRTPTISERASLGVAGLEANLYAMREEIKSVRNMVPADGKTRIVNMSWGQSIAEVADQLAGKAKSDAPDYGEVYDSLRARTGQYPSDKQVRGELARRLAIEMKSQLSDKSHAETIRKLKSELQDEVNEAINKGLVIFNGAGNGRKIARDFGDEDLSTFDTASSVKGIISVGAADLGVTSDSKDDAMWEESAPGAAVAIAAPGANVPVYVPLRWQFEKNGKPVNGSGTSFASPYAASVVALMIAANPKITPKQIEEILKSGRVTKDLPGNTDGKGLLDPVKAVEEAKKLAGR